MGHVLKLKEMTDASMSLIFHMYGEESEYHRKLELFEQFKYVV
jgi:hypothetical protein